MADLRRIEAIDNDAPDRIMEKWVERGKTIDEFGAGSSEARVWLMDNPDTHTWALNNELLEDDGTDWNEPVLRLNVDLSALDEESDEFAVVKRKIQAHTEGFTQIDSFVEYYQEEVKGFRQERFLIENPDFAAEMKEIKGIEPPDYIPPVEYDELLEKEERTPEEELKIAGWDKKIPLKYSKVEGSPIDDYVGFYSIDRPDNWVNREGTSLPWYEDDWFMIEHQAFYKEVYLKILENDRLDFRLTPTREIGAKYLTYLRIVNNQAKRDQYRLDNPDLDEWGVSVGIWTRTMTEKRRRAGLTPSERFAEEVLEREEEFEETLEEIEKLE